jgi:indole-3-glycerol phosphate synthase
MAGEPGGGSPQVRNPAVLSPFAMPDTLAEIVAHARSRVAHAKALESEAALLARAAEAGPPRPFVSKLAAARAAGELALIAECKRASPSRGLIRADFDPARLARAYESGGAACLSVLTEPRWFQGADGFVAEAKAACELPVLRKDFTVDPWQVIEARAIGADAVLLILAALSDEQAAELEAAAIELGLGVLAEAHDAAELERACRLKTPLVGINNRDLRSLEVDPDLALRLGGRVPADRIVVAESGLGSHADLQRYAEAGVSTFLVGESLMRQADVTAATRALLGAAAL